MNYLETYGSKQRRFQEGGVAPAPAAPAGPEAGGGQEEQIVQLAEAAQAGDQQAAAELGMIMAPMILEEIQAAAGAQGAPAGPEAGGGEPVFRKGGKFVGNAR
jgi:hypothetical protein